MESQTTPEQQLQNSKPPSLFPISISTATSSNFMDQQHSLFPIPSAAATAESPQWLRNTSFTTNLSVISDAVSSHQINTDSALEVIEPEPSPHTEPIPSYELLECSEEEEKDTSERKKMKKKKKKRKREINDSAAFSYGSRKSGVRAWANSEIKPSKDYYFDSRGDPDNLAFGSLYKMDIGRYKVHDSSTRLETDMLVYSLSRQGLFMRGELDVDGLDLKLRSSGRYWSAKYSALERHKSFKRIRIVSMEKHYQVIFDDFIPLSDDDDDASEASVSRPLVVEESWEDEVMRNTREFNKMTREHPHNVRVWLDFAEFQDKVASKQPQKGARLQTFEKKISILEKAAELNPENEDLLICLLKAYQCKDSSEVLFGRWEKVLMQHSGSYRLWREFLHVVQEDFSSFKVSQLRSMYAHAIQALYTASGKKQRQVHPVMDLPSEDNVELDVELSMVDIFLSLCRFEWQAGYHELATALFQAEIEYCLFCPPLHLTEQSKKRLLEHFWNSSGARVGEDGALGWSTWLEKEEETRQKILLETTSREDEQGSWTGWFVPVFKDQENSPQLKETINTDVPLEGMDEEKEDEGANSEEDDAALLRMLGIDADAEATKEVHDIRAWVRWSEEESLRDRDQWLPVRGNSGVSRCKEDVDEADEEISRVILFEDVSDYLFSLRSPKARLSLVMQFIDFFGGEISCWTSTNSSSWNEKILSLEALPDSILHYIRSSIGDEKLETGSSTFILDIPLQYPDSSAKRSIMKFLRNAVLLCLRVFPRNYKLEEAVLFAEEKTHMEIKTVEQGMPSRALAKQLLKNDRQDVLLCGVYARREASFGNIGHARKVFDMALSAIGALHLENQSAPMLSFWYAEMELAGSSSSESESSSRAMHILSCLGSGSNYSPYKGRPPSTLLLRAHQGFKDCINAVRSLWARELVDDSSVTMVCSAALFEQLTAGWAAGVKLLSDSLSMVLPERKRQSYQLECLFNFLMKMLQNHHQEAKLSKTMLSVLTGLQLYPFSPGLFCSLVRLTHLHTVPNKLRWILDDIYQKKPSVILSLFALSYELNRGCSQHRIHGLFERALSNDRLHSSVLLWRCYVAYEVGRGNLYAARRVFFRAIHACPWSKMLWLDGFQKLNSILSAKELLDLQEVMREKELNLRTDIYEILLEDEFNPAQPLTE